MHHSLSFFAEQHETLRNSKTLAQSPAFVVRPFLRRAQRSTREIPRLENYTPPKNVGLSLTHSGGLKLNDEVNVRFLWDFEMQRARRSL